MVTTVMTPHATTNAIDTICPRARHASRSSFRSRVPTLTPSPFYIRRSCRPLVGKRLYHDSVVKPYDPLSHRRNRRIVGDNGRRCSQLAIQVGNDLQDEPPRQRVECAG